MGKNDHPNALQTSKTIIFIRHGKPRLRSLYALMRPIKGKLFNRYCREYDQSTIDPEYPPPQSVVNIIGDARHYVSSDLRRAKDSSAMLQFTNTVFYKSLREAEIPQTTLTEISMPLIAWLVFSRIKWRMGVSDSTSESRQAFLARIQHIGELLHLASREKPSIAVMSHGITIHYLKRALMDRGWQPGHTSIRHWGVTRLDG